MKKVFSLILALLMVLSMLALAACNDKTPSGDDPDQDDPSKNPSGGDDPGQQEEEEPKIEPDLPDMTFGNEEFHFYQYNSGSLLCWNDIWVEEYSGDTIDNAVFARNSYIEEKHQVDITLTIDEYQLYHQNVLKAVSTSDDLYDVCVSMGHHNPGTGSGDIFYNLYNIEYIDFDKSWWGQTALADLTLAGYLPFVVSDLTILDKGATSGTFFNKKMAEDYEMDNFYQMVFDGTWTYEEMIYFGEIVSQETGDDIWNDQDIYGLVCGDDPVEMLFHGFGMRHAAVDENGYPEVRFTDDGNFAKIQTYLEEVMFNETLTYNREWYPDTKGFSEMFAQNQGLFMMYKINAVKSLMQTMEEDYGILPIPKWDEDQESYYSSVSVFGCNLLSIPTSNTEPDKAGFILEALSAESKYTLIPAFYDVVLKGRAAKDAESKEVLDIILSTMVFDLGEYYAFANFNDDFLRITGNANSQGHNTPKRSSDIASFWAERESKFNAAVESLIETINEWTVN